MYYPIINSIKPTTITRNRDPKAATTIITMASNVKLTVKGKMRETTPHCLLRKWKTGATVVVALRTRVQSVRRRTAHHGLNGRSIKLPNCGEFSRCSNT